MTVRNTGFKELQKSLKKLARSKRFVATDSVIVAYVAEYAIFVHEDLQAKHKQGKQSKFLEQPARKFGAEIGEAVVKAFDAGATFNQALLIGGFFLQRLSQKIVPVDTGNLRAGAFTALSKNEDEAAAKAHSRGLGALQRAGK